MKIVRQLLFTIVFLQFAYPQVVPTLQPKLFYEDATASLRGASRPFVDSNGNVIIITTQFSIDCPFGVCGTNIYSVAPNGVPNWIKPDTGFASHAVNQIALGADNTIFFQDFAQLGQVLAYSSAGVPVPGWPVNLGFPLATGPHTLVVDPLDGSILVKGGTSFSFSTFPGRVASYRPNGTLKWQTDFPNAPNNTPGMILGPNDAVYAFSDRGVILAGNTGNPQCNFELPPIAGGSAGVFTDNGTQIIRINPDCTGSIIFTEAAGSLALTDYDNNILFGIDGPKDSLFAVRSDGTFLWRNQTFIPSGSTFISAIHGGRLYVIGIDLVDQKQKLFILDETTGAILDAADTTGICVSCGVAVASDGTIYLNDLQSTRIYVIGSSSGTISVTTDNPAATFTISDNTGTSIQGSGTSFSQVVPAGTYTVTFGAVPGFATPSEQTQTLAPGGSITFNGQYVDIVPFLVTAQSSVSFTYPVTFTGPVSPQSIAISSTVSSISFQATAETESAGNWLFVHPERGVTPAGVSINVRNGLQPGAYKGHVTLTSLAAQNSPLTIDVALTVTPAPIPVLLVHGFCSDPASTFGNFSSLLTADGLSVAAPFDYSQHTQVKNGNGDESIEQLAARLAIRVDELLRSTRAAQVDLVAHSMGGLITRAWMAGLSTGNIPYRGQIRKLIMISTPQYGATDAKWNELVSELGHSCSIVQSREMTFGGDFITRLDRAWDAFEQFSPFRMQPADELFIAGTRSDGVFECGPSAHGCSDGIVEIASAVLKDAASDHVRYVPYKHAHTDLLLPALSSSDRAVAFIDGPEHKAYRLIRDFLQSGSVEPQCCGASTIDYDPPQAAGRSKQQGLLILRFIDAQTGQDIPGNHTFSQLGFLPLELPEIDYNNQTNTATGAFVGVGFPAGQYDLNIAIPGYRLGSVSLINVNVARPTFTSIALEPQ